MSTLLASASLTIFMGVSSAFGGVTSASYSMTHWPSMETCIQAVNKEVDTVASRFTITELERLKEGEYGKSVKYGNTLITYHCRPLENK